MIKSLTKILLPLILFLAPGLGFSQAITLGTSAQFVLFTTVGAVTNSGTGYLTHLTGKVGSNSGSSTGFGNVDGSMNSGDAVTIAAAANLLTAYNQLNTATPTAYPSASLGNGATMVAGVYSISGPATLNGNLTLDAQGNPSAVFIFQINGALSSGANAKVKIINGGVACNVYWKVEGLVGLASGTTMRGNIVAHNAAISLGTLDTLEGRALSINGAITLNSLTAATPIGCGSPTLTGPTAPTFGAVGGYAIFSSNGPVSNGGGISYVTGDVGTNLGLTTGYNPLYVTGTIHPVPDGSTAAAAPALSTAYGQLNALPVDIILLYPAIFGHNLVLTPHTYALNAATSLTDTLYLNAQGNPAAVFVIRVNGAFSTISGAVVKLMNGTQSKNVYWQIEGAVSLGSNTIFHGNIIANNGAIDLLPGANLTGRALSTTGAITTNGNTINAPFSPSSVITSDSAVCTGSSIPLSGYESGGVWSVSNTHASITSGGILTGISAGIDTVKYVVTNGFGTATATKIITVQPVSTVGPIAGPSGVCIGSTITLTNSAPGGTWSSSNANATIVNGLVTGVTSGIDTITYSVTNACGNSSVSKIITVNTLPTVNAVPNQVVCAGSPTAAVAFTGTGTTYTWTNDNATIGLSGAGSGNIASFTALNSTNAAVLANITVTPSNGCAGTSTSFTITVNPAPNTVTVTNQTVCNGAQTTAVVNSGTVAGTSFAWTNNNTSVGLAGSGTGNIPAFTALNGTSVPAVANITVTPSANGCTGSGKSFLITVNPTPNVAAISNQAVCNGAPTASIIYTGSVNGTAFTWTNDNVSIGLGATGNGDIPSFTALNTTSAPTVANINVTPSANGCTGAAKRFAITVNPTPTTDAVASQTLCNGFQTKAIAFAGTVNGTSFTWTNDNVTIGLAGAGAGNIPAFAALNTTNAPVVAKITVTPTANGCTGLTSEFTITVNNTPTAPVIALTTPPSVCDMTYFRNFGAATLPPAGINYSWSAINASVSDTGNTQQYALINFKKTGTATVVLTATVNATGCLNTGGYNVDVTGNVADVPAQVIYFNKSFVCLQNNEEAYAWGYDNANSLAPTLLHGEMNQDYVNASPNLDSNKYWVMVTHNGCTQKTYYNKPPRASMAKLVTGVTVFPNPANGQIQVVVNVVTAGDIKMEIYGTLGQKMFATDNFTNSSKVDVSGFAAGVYMIICYQNGEKITTRFIKN